MAHCMHARTPEGVALGNYTALVCSSML